MLTIVRKPFSLSALTSAAVIWPPTDTSFVSLRGAFGSGATWHAPTAAAISIAAAQRTQELIIDSGLFDCLGARRRYRRRAAVEELGAKLRIDRGRDLGMLLEVEARVVLALPD